jgi:hypothetical protein
MGVMVMPKWKVRMRQLAKRGYIVMPSPGDRPPGRGGLVPRRGLRGPGGRLPVRPAGGGPEPLDLGAR